MPPACDITHWARKPSVLRCSKTERPTKFVDARAHGGVAAHMPHAAYESVGGSPATGQPCIKVTNGSAAFSIPQSRSTTSARDCSAWDALLPLQHRHIAYCTTEASFALPTLRLRVLSAQCSATHKPRTGIHQSYAPNCPRPNRP